MRDVSRRRFLQTAAAGGLLGAAGGRALVSSEPDSRTWPTPEPVKIYKVYAGRTGGIYLSRPTDEIAKLDAHLAGIEKKLGDVKFIGGDLIPDVDVEQVAAKIKDADAVILFHLSGHGGDAPVLGRLIDVGLPTAVFSQPFSGHGWMYFPAWRKAGKKVVLLPTSDWTELDRVAALMRAPSRLRQTKIIVVNRPLGTAPACSAEAVKEKLGCEVIPVSIEETIKRHEAVDPKAAEAEAEEYWLSKAKAVVEPTREEVVNSARFYLALKGLMLEHGARAITSSGCMGAPAKGCLAFSKLNDMGLVGACEGDMDSTLTMILFSHAFGVPGFITDPVFDTARNALIHFHCTSATRMDGIAGERHPFSIRTQTDSGRGVALDVEMRLNQPVTCAKFVNLDTMLVSTGTIREVTHDTLGCRTQFVTEVADARKMFLNWGADVLQGDTMTLLHRVVFYGNHLEGVKHMGELMGFKVIEEV